MSKSIALSTSWFPPRECDCGYSLCQKAVSLGFSQLELSHNLDISLCFGIVDAFAQKLITVSSVHNFFPIPPGAHGPCPDFFQSSSNNEEEIYLWQRYTERSLDFCQKLQAKVLVMHMGSIPLRFPYSQWRLNKLYQKKTPEELKEHRYFLKVRKKVQEKYEAVENQVIQRLQPIINYSQKNNVSLGIENRERLTELPVDDKMNQFISRLNNCGYWHDSGHAKLKERAGILGHEKHLAENADNMLGLHLKDVSERGSESIRLGKGTVDFKMIAKYVRPEHILVLEVGPSMSEQDLVDSRKFLEDIFF